MTNLFKGETGKFVLAGLAVITAIIVFNVWIESSSWYQKLKAKK